MNRVTTRSGGFIDFVFPEESVFTLEDIAIGLKREHRFANQLKEDWTVLDHSLLCEDLARDAGHPPLDRLACLLHDASEAFMRDLPSPLKSLCPSYKTIEVNLSGVIYERFLDSIPGYNLSLGVSWKLVHEIDQLAQKYETFRFRRETPSDSIDLYYALTSYRGVEEFIDKYHRLLIASLKEKQTFTIPHTGPSA